MPNNPISGDVKERIKELGKQDWAIRRIATETGTSRPTVRKYLEDVKKD